jgi:Putative sugar-binding domain
MGRTVKRTLRRGSKSSPSEEDDRELAARIMRQFCSGKTARQIADELDLGRQKPYAVLYEEASKHRLQYIAPLEYSLRDHIEQRWLKLSRVRVVHSALPDDVAYQTATLLIELIKDHFESDPPPLEIHIGFAGGRLLRETARILARAIESTFSLHDKHFHFHAVLAASNMRNPWNDPNAFFGYFADSPVIRSTFWGLPAPGIVTREEFIELQRIRGVQEAFEQAKKLDVIVTSAGAHWATECSRLAKLYATFLSSSDSFQQLNEEGCLGDLIWRPFNEAGPILRETPIRAMTPLEVSDLAVYVREHKKVVLALALCGTCGKPKTEALRAILNWKPPISQTITHLVLDSLTARSLLR